MWHCNEWVNQQIKKLDYYGNTGQQQKNFLLQWTFCCERAFFLSIWNGGRIDSIRSLLCHWAGVYVYRLVYVCELVCVCWCPEAAIMTTWCWQCRQSPFNILPLRARSVCHRINMYWHDSIWLQMETFCTHTHIWASQGEVFLNILYSFLGTGKRIGRNTTWVGRFQKLRSLYCFHNVKFEMKCYKYPCTKIIANF